MHGYGEYIFMYWLISILEENYSLSYKQQEKKNELYFLPCCQLYLYTDDDYNFFNILNIFTD